MPGRRALARSGEGGTNTELGPKDEPRTPPGAGVITLVVLHRNDDAALDEAVDQLTARLTRAGGSAVEQLAAGSPTTGAVGVDKREQNVAH